MPEDFNTQIEEQSATHHPQNQNHNSFTQTQREADKKMLEIIDTRLHALSATQNRMGMFLLSLCLVIIVETFVLVGFGIWIHYSQSKAQDVIEKHEIEILNSVQGMSDEIEKISVENKSCMERIRKYVWELKESLNLKFSQQRSAENLQEPDGED